VPYGFNRVLGANVDVGLNCPVIWIKVPMFEQGGPDITCPVISGCKQKALTCTRGGIGLQESMLMWARTALSCVQVAIV
jgi:hypothetical protein